MNELPKRKQIRLKNYDYSKNGYYYITICTNNKEKILSDICTDGTVQLLSIGNVVKMQMNEISKQYNIAITRYVIMPNHVHMIIKINDTAECFAYTISDIICAFKSKTTIIANKNDNCPGRKIWQRSFYEHIIRNEDDYMQIIEYIKNNPLKYILKDE